MLHFAPEPALQKLFKAAPRLDYVCADLNMKGALRADITSMPFKDAEFDYVICFHVLEHVRQDRQAMSELRRVLRPGGVAWIQVPVGGKPTDEDPNVRDPSERRHRFGQANHVRRYGPDIVGRLEEAGFSVKTLRPLDIADAETLERCAIPITEHPIFVCRA